MTAPARSTAHDGRIVKMTYGKVSAARLIIGISIERIVYSSVASRCMSLARLLLAENVFARMTTHRADKMLR
jgi:hypothetical protein